MNGSNKDIVWSPGTTKGKEMFLKLTMMQAKGNIDGKPSVNKRVVIQCADCGKLFWGGHNTHRCGRCAYIKYKETLKAEQEARSKRNRVSGKPITSEDEEKFSDRLKKLLDAELAAERTAKANAAAVQLNEQLACPLYGCKGSLQCAACKRGINYLSGKPDVSTRCCPDHPVAGAGNTHMYKTSTKVLSTGAAIYGQYMVYDAEAKEYRVVCKPDFFKEVRRVEQLKAARDGGEYDDSFIKQMEDYL